MRKIYMLLFFFYRYTVCRIRSVNNVHIKQETALSCKSDKIQKSKFFFYPECYCSLWRISNKTFLTMNSSYASQDLYIYSQNTSNIFIRIASKNNHQMQVLLKNARHLRANGDKVGTFSYLLHKFLNNRLVFRQQRSVKTNKRNRAIAVIVWVI